MTKAEDFLASLLERWGETFDSPADESRAVHGLLYPAARIGTQRDRFSSDYEFERNVTHLYELWLGGERIIPSPDLHIVKDLAISAAPALTFLNAILTAWLYVQGQKKVRIKIKDVEIETIGNVNSMELKRILDMIFLEIESYKKSQDSETSLEIEFVDESDQDHKTPS